ncbi:MAG TPA: hypothetical protein VGS19_30360 [Streptosporangiaceae bacterium]|nr:hypothetical protein [Streptosporangiaceae bacterium]
MSPSPSSRHARGRWLAVLFVGAAIAVAVPGLAHASTAGHPSQPTQQALPAWLQAEIKANNAAGLPGLDRGVTVPAGCDIRTSMDTNGRPRIERERTQHRLLNQGQSPGWIAVANAQLKAYLQAAVRDYCAATGH